MSKGVCTSASNSKNVFALTSTLHPTFCPPAIPDAPLRPSVPLSHPLMPCTVRPSLAPCAPLPASRPLPPSLPISPTAVQAVRCPPPLPGSPLSLPPAPCCERWSPPVALISRDQTLVRSRPSLVRRVASSRLFTTPPCGAPAAQSLPLTAPRLPPRSLRCPASPRRSLFRDPPRPPPAPSSSPWRPSCRAGAAATAAPRPPRPTRW